MVSLTKLNIGMIAGLGVFGSALAQGQKPNVIILYADDVGYGDFSCNGSKTISTPNIDAVAASGIRFTDAHAVAATSTPSRYSLLTGEYAFRRAGTDIAAGDAPTIIKPEQYTMADMFKEAGYTTGVVGKWHLGLGEQGQQDWNGYMTSGPKDLGFDYSFIMAATSDRVPCVFMENQRVVGLDVNDPISVSYKSNFPGEPTGKENPELLTKLKPSHGHDNSIVNGISRIGYMKGGKNALWVDENIADTITAKAVRFIESSKEQPFFLYFGTNDIHVPRVPNPRFVGKSGMGARGDAILELDWTVGEIVSALERYNLRENTILIISSDNGPVIDDGYQDRAEELLGEHKPSGIYRGGKYSAFEAGTRVPCIISWSGHIQPAVSPVTVGHIDLFASFAGMLGHKLPAGAAVDSYDARGSWFGTNPANRAFTVEYSVDHTFSLIIGEWKYIEPSQSNPVNYWTKTETGNHPSPQLYNLAEDPGEKHNLADKYPEKVERFERVLANIVWMGKPELDKGTRVLKVVSAEATSFENNQNIDKSYDRHPQSMYHSNYKNGKVSAGHPVLLTYQVEDADVSKIIYCTRTDVETNGNIKEMDLFASKDGTNYVKIGSYDFKGEKGRHEITFDGKRKALMAGMKYIRFAVKSAAGDYVSCSEMIFLHRK